MIEFYKDILDGPIYWVVAIISIVIIFAIIGFIMEQQQKAKLHKESQVKYTNNMFEQSMNEMANSNANVQRDVQEINNVYREENQNNEYYTNTNQYNNVDIPYKEENYQYNSNINTTLNFDNMNYNDYGIGNNNSSQYINQNNQEQVNNNYTQSNSSFTVNNSFNNNLNNATSSDDDTEFL